MDFTEVMQLLKNASPYDLYRIKVAIQNEIEKPEHIRTMRECFAIGDKVSYFDSDKNTLIDAIVLEKNPKNAVLKNLCDQQRWNTPYYMINLTGKKSDIHTNHKERPTKNNFKVGDCVGFNNDGQQCIGTIIKLNHKTASLITRENKRWRVGYGLLFKILDGERGDVTAGSLSYTGNLIDHDVLTG
ncbi:MAG: hypothetical protein NTU49_10900 [Gammaproteobacteria bacterium]|nr:hypothetical protein [Gammaproteobacteria bacterium]